MADPPARAGPAGVATGSGTGPVGGRGRRRAAAARARASLQPVLLALLLLANPGAARGEMGFALQSAVPMTIGLEFGAGMHLAWELALAGGFTPPLYVGIIQELAEDQQSSDIIEGTLQRALSTQALIRFFPVQGFGLYLVIGYDVFWVSGEIEGPRDPRHSSAQALEEPDTGSGLPGGGGGGGAGGTGGGTGSFDPKNPGKPPTDGGGGDSTDPGELPRQREEVASTIHGLHAGLGYRQFFGKFYFQGELAVLKALKASSSPAELADYLDQTYTENLLVPFLGLAVGLRI